MEDIISFTTDDGEEVNFYIYAETSISGRNYLLVTDSNEDEADAYILEEVGSETEDEVSYEIVEDETTLDALSKLFEEQLDEIDIEVERGN